jgi:hypothetical protein
MHFAWSVLLTEKDGELPLDALQTILERPAVQQVVAAPLAKTFQPLRIPP